MYTEKSVCFVLVSFVIGSFCSLAGSGSFALSDVNEVRSGLSVVLDKLPGIRGASYAKKYFETLFADPDGQVTRVSVELAADIVKLAFRAVLRENSGQRFSPKELTAARELLRGGGQAKRRVFRWLCRSYRALSVPVKAGVGEQGVGVCAATVLSEFINQSVAVWKGVDPLSYKTLKELVMADGTLLLPAKNLAKDIAASRAVVILCGTDGSASLWEALKERSLFVMGTAWNFGAPPLMGFVAALFTLRKNVKECCSEPVKNKEPDQDETRKNLNKAVDERLDEFFAKKKLAGGACRPVVCDVEVQAVGGPDAAPERVSV